MVGDYLISKKEGSDREYARLAPSLPAEALVSHPKHSRSSQELLDLWSRRVISLSPRIKTN
jgi:hypothetical protein